VCSSYLNRFASLDQNLAVFASPTFDRSKPRFLVLKRFSVRPKLRSVSIAHNRTIQHNRTKHLQWATNTAATRTITVAIRVSHAPGLCLRPSHLAINRFLKPIHNQTSKKNDEQSNAREPRQRLFSMAGFHGRGPVIASVL
jgi:hypothetical protein